MRKCKVVYGTAGCGKTKYAEALMEKLGCTRVIDYTNVLGDLDALDADVLVLTNEMLIGAINFSDVIISKDDNHIEPSTWIVEVSERGVKLMRVRDSQNQEVIEVYPWVNRGVGAINLSAICHGYQPPRILARQDIPFEQIPPEYAS
ncbi:MAG: hypothetical protein WC742_12490 [Gallionellaceae bacterium]|jgi:hypothetical protein